MTFGDSTVAMRALTLAPDGARDRARSEPDPVEDATVAQARAGDARAFQRLYRLHRNAVTRVVARMLGPRGQASAIEDVTQEVFLQVFRALPDFRGESRFATWVHSVAAHVTLMHLRSTRCRPWLTHELPGEAVAPEGDSPLAGLTRRERLRALDRVLATLTDKKRLVYVLHDLEGMSPAEIATVVDAPVFTVRTRLFYARREVYAAMARDPSLAPVLSAAGLAA